MSLRVAFLLCAFLGLPAMAARAADIANDMSSYQRIASHCGEDPSKPSYSDADYAEAMSDAARAMRDASGSSQRAAIQQLVDRLNECRAEETRKFAIPPIHNCQAYINEYKKFLARSASLEKAGKITASDAVAVRRDFFLEPAKNCIRDLMANCLDPTKTSQVDLVIDAFHWARGFDFINTTERMRGLKRSLTEHNPFLLKMRFCTDTDFACKGGQDTCNRRIEQIKAIMQTWMGN